MLLDQRFLELRKFFVFFSISHKKIDFFCVINNVRQKRRIFMKIKEIVSELLIEAIKVKASDIFFFPKKENLMVKFRTGKGLIEYAGFT